MSIYGSYLDLQRSIRTNRYKLITYPIAGVLRLYDVSNDPKEMYDLAGAAESKPLLIELFAKLQDRQRKMNDDLDLSALSPQ